jgi:pimeloyl-ACP methyl ester carboxylesterase
LSLLAIACHAPAPVRYSFTTACANAATCGRVIAATCGSGDNRAPDGAAWGDGERCVVRPGAVNCPPRVAHLDAGRASRDVYWQTPMTPAPSTGYPVVVLYQGSFYPPSTTWGTVAQSAPYGGYYQARLQAMLLKHGFVVIAPTATLGVAWQTNSILPWSVSSDRPFLDALFAAMERGEFDRLDPSRWYATGISSGGYMTSRMALSYGGRFRALAIQSGSWATCSGPLCTVPDVLPPDHPPTLFLHGAHDVTVPLSTAREYFDRLVMQGFTAQMDVDEDASHEWLAIAPESITRWFECH